MVQLSDTQLVVLSAAASHAHGAVILPEHLKGGAAEKVVSALLAKELIEEVTAGPGMPAWRDADGPVALRITACGLAAIGIEPHDGAGESGAAASPPIASPEPPAQAAPSKQAVLIELLRRPEGASINRLVAATGWQAHSIRGAISGTLKKKLGHSIASEQTDAGRVYRIVA